jgi:Flp pilus assembly protein TadD
MRKILITALACFPLATPSHATAGGGTDYLVGHVAAESGDYATADAKFAAVLAHNPGNQDVLNEDFLVQAMSGGKDTLRLAKLLPKNPVAILVVANDAAARGQWDQAEALFASLPDANPFNVMRPVLEAWCEAGAGRNLAAIQQLQSAAPQSALAGLDLLHAAFIADIAGRPGDAAAFYRSAQMQTSRPPLRFILAQTSFMARSGQINTARGELADVLSAVPQDRMALPRLTVHIADPLVSTPQQGIAEYYLAVGGDMDGSGSTPQSIEVSRIIMQMAVTLRPDLTMARLISAGIDQQGTHFDQALAMLAPVAATDPLDALVRMTRAQLLDQSGKTSQSLDVLKQIAVDYPGFTEPYELMGEIDEARGRSMDAVTAYDAAIKLRGTLAVDDWPLLYDRAVALQDDGNWPAAENDLQTALKLSPNQPSLLNFLGYSWADQNRNLPQARTLLEHAVQLAPRDGAILDSLGWVKFRQGEVDSAVTTLETAVQLVPEDPDVNTHLGDAYAATGRKLEARYQWQFALTLHPSVDAAAKLRAKLAWLEHSGS